MKVLAVDPGEKRIGLAISDPTCTLARPLMVIRHEARAKDAEKIAAVAKDEAVGLIIVGWALDSEGEIGYRARKAQRLAEALRQETDIMIKMWDESGTTQAAIQSRIDLGISRKKRQGHMDDQAASILLQDFLNENDAAINALGDENAETP
jgi:putative Holliday junction resolvase